MELKSLTQHKNYLLKNAHLIDPSQSLDGLFDVEVEDGFIKYCEPVIDRSSPLRQASIPSADLETKLLAPGLVDVHTHLREPGFEYKETIESGTRAAASGGVTSILCMANTNPVNDNPYVTQFINSRIKESAIVNVYPVGALSKGLKGEQLAEIGKMREAGIVAVSDDGMPVMNSYLMRKALDYCKAFSLPIISHAEDAYLVGSGVMNEGMHSHCLGLRGIPNESEEILVARDIALARLTGGHVHFAHISTRQSIAHIRRAKAEGLKITTEVTPHHLYFTDEDVGGYDSNFKMAPPLRSDQDRVALIEALREGVIDCIATDHAPHATRDKDVLFEFAANGVLGLETSWRVGLDLVERKFLTLSQLVDRMSTSPAKIFSLNAGSLKVGKPADFFISEFSSAKEFQANEIQSKSKNSPFTNKKLFGKILFTSVKGKGVWNSIIS